MKRDLAEALAVVQDLLDRTGDAMATGNVEAFCDCFALPTVIDTFEGQVQVNSRAELAERFHCVRSVQNAGFVTDVVRHVVEADWFDEDTIHVTHQSRQVSGTTLVQAPYVVFSIVKRSGDLWLISFSQYAITDSIDLNNALAGAQTSNQEKLND